MTPAIPLADPLPLPAPVGLLWVLLQLTFTLHLVAMNVVLGGSILALHWRFSRRAEGAPHRAALVAFFARALPVAVAATVTLGVAPLLFVQVLYGRLFFTSSILMAWFWLAVIPLVILAYYGAYLLAFRGEASPGRSRALAAGVTALFAAVGFLYVSNVTRALRPGTFLDAYHASGRGVVLNLGDVHYIDSMGLGDIISSYTTLCRAGGHLKLANVVPRIHEFLQHAGLLTVFEVFRSEDDAVSSFHG